MPTNAQRQTIMLFDEQIVNKNKKRSKNLLKNEPERGFLLNQAQERLEDLSAEIGDCNISFLELHLQNDPKAFIKSLPRESKPNVIIFWGGETLTELRPILSKADEAIYGGTFPRIIPMIDVKDAGRLASHAGVKEPVSFSEKIHVEYATIKSLFKDIRAIGEQNTMVQRRKTYERKAWLNYLEENYKPTTFTFELITIIGY